MIYGNLSTTGTTESVAADTGVSEEVLNACTEMYIVDEVSHLTDEQIQEFCNSPEAEALVEAGKLRRKTLVRLSKKDDMSRRKTMAAFQLARDKKDPLWAKLVKNRVQERKLIGQIEQKYGTKAERVAKLGQRDYLKNQMTPSFMRAGGADR